MSKFSFINTFSCHVEAWITNPSAHVSTPNVKITWNYTMHKTSQKQKTHNNNNNNDKTFDTAPRNQKLKRKGTILLKSQNLVLLCLCTCYIMPRTYGRPCEHMLMLSMWQNHDNHGQEGYFEKSCKCCNYRCNLNKQQQVFQRLASPWCTGICVHYSQVN